MKNIYEQPISVYEVHLGSWRRPTDGRRYFNYRELAVQLVEYVKPLGFTHVQLLPVTEHPFDGSWGYQTTGYFAPTSRFGSPHDFMFFVDYCHEHGIGVLMDWVPAHFPTDAHSLGNFDGTALYEHADPRKGFHPDWGTLIFNYGRTEVADFLLSSARFWMDVYHVDGLRVDAWPPCCISITRVKPGMDAEYVRRARESGSHSVFERFERCNPPGFSGRADGGRRVDFLGWCFPSVYTGGLGFGFKWDMGWMNDTLRYFRRDPIYRRHHQNELSFRMVYAFTENFMLPLSHDEVVHGKRSLISQMPGDHWQQFANLRVLYGYQFTTPGKKLLFMGGEIAQWTDGITMLNSIGNSPNSSFITASRN